MTLLVGNRPDPVDRDGQLCGSLRCVEKPPKLIDDFEVVEYGYLGAPMLPTGYVAHHNGATALEPMQCFAVCVVEGVAGFYLLCCTPEWRYVTYSFNELMSSARRQVGEEFGCTIDVWHRWYA